MADVDAPAALTQQAADIQREVDALRTAMGAGGRGFGGGGGGGNGPRSLRQLLAYAGGVQRADAMPTEQEREALDKVPSALQEQMGRLNRLVTERMPAFFRALDEAGVPWTPGRPVR